MRSTQTVLSLLLASVAVGCLTACEQPSTSDVDQTEEGVLRLGTVEAVDTMSRAVAPNDRPLVIDGFRGRVDLRGADQETAELRFVRRGRGEDAETARGVLEDVTISESGSQDAYTYSLETEGAAYSEVDVRGTVPRQSNLRVEQTSGPVFITGVKGALTVAHEHGPVTVRGAASSVDVEIRNGNLQAHFSSLPTDAEVRLRTENGDITLRLPPAASTQLSAQTDVGVIRTRGLALSEERYRPRDAGGRYTAQLGPGAASVELRTQNGSILIEAADTAQTDTTDRAPVADSLRPPVPGMTGDTTPPSPTRVDTIGEEAARPDTTITDTTGIDTSQS